MSNNEIYKLQLIGDCYAKIATADAHTAKWYAEVMIPFLESKTADELVTFKNLCA